jgi:uncharacterized DUF497 family protein
MRFVWEVKKSAKTLRERGFSFADASLVFNDPLRWIEAAKVGRDGEVRWLTIGRASFELAPSFVAVVYTEREINDKKTTRIISARAANRKEVRKIERRNAQIQDR